MGDDPIIMLTAPIPASKRAVAALWVEVGRDIRDVVGV